MTFEVGNHLLHLPGAAEAGADQSRLRSVDHLGLGQLHRDREAHLARGDGGSGAPGGELADKVSALLPEQFDRVRAPLRRRAHRCPRKVQAPANRGSPRPGQDRGRRLAGSVFRAQSESGARHYPAQHRAPARLRLDAEGAAAFIGATPDVGQAALGDSAADAPAIVMHNQ